MFSDDISSMITHSSSSCRAAHVCVLPVFPGTSSSAAASAQCAFTEAISLPSRRKCCCEAEKTWSVSEVSPHLEDGCCTSTSSLSGEWHNRPPGYELMKIAWRCIENPPAQGQHRNLGARGSSRCHELKFKLVLPGAFPNQPLYERCQVGNQGLKGPGSN